MSYYKNILVAIDVYEDFQPLLDEAQKFANRQQAKLHCAYVSPIITSSVPYAYDFQNAVEKEALEILAKIKSSIGCETILLQGSASQKICEYAKAIQADLILCGSHGRHGIGLLLGSTANGILHNSHCDALTIRLDSQSKPMTSSEYQNIVLATDLKADSSKVAIAAKNLAQNYKAQLHIIHAITYVAATVAAYYPEIETDLKQEAQKSMLQLSQELNVDLSQSKIEFGPPKQSILKAIDSHHAELLVIGSHGKSAFASAMLGSTANAVLHAAKCNILVIRI
ncbi:MAG: universal stress protein [Gammaproteobacteria bacterium]|jgi:universal stress protein A|nr:universal stress protein [Gammaproteobacteria bacterium]